MGIFELLLVAGMALGGTNVVQTQPLLWIGANLARAAGPASLLLLTLREQPQPSPAVWSGPAYVLPPPASVPSRFAPPPPPRP